MIPSIKIYVASLASELERRASVMAQIGQLGLPFEIVDAVDARTMAPEERAQHLGDMSYFRARYTRDMKPGELGCALTHQRIYRQMIAENVDIALILEDDFWIPDVQHPDLRSLLTQASFDWLILGYPARTAFEARHAYWLDPVRVTQRLSAGFVVGDSPRRKNHGALAYAVTRAAAIQAIEPVIVTLADDHPYFEQRLNVCHLRPLLVIERPGLVSSINGTLRRAGSLSLLRRHLSRVLSAIPKWLRLLSFRKTSSRWAAS